MSILIRDVQVEGDVTQVYIEGNRIVEIGKKREADTVIDGKGKIALPGFVNLHTHAAMTLFRGWGDDLRSEEHTSELQSRLHLVCRLLLEKKKKKHPHNAPPR